MPGVFRGEAFVGEYMAKVCAAADAGHFGPIAADIGNTPDRARDLIVEARPAAAGGEFVL